MRTKTLGSLEVSVVGLGCNNFGMRCDAAQTAAVVNAAIDAGITLFDTADVYGGQGRSEELLGQALGARRDEVLVATKFGMPMGAEGEAGASARWIGQAVENSLRRLGTDRIDLYQLHAPDAETPIEETLAALDALVRAGKVREIGNSNFDAAQLRAADDASTTAGLARFVTAQNYYNVLNRHVDNDVAPAAVERGLGVLPYFPLANGLLTGKYHRGEAPPDGTRLAGVPADRADRVLSDKNFDKVEALEKLAADQGHTILELAIAWLATQPHVASVIAGATKPEQVVANAAAGAWQLDADVLAAVDIISPPPSG
ncbi:MAG TPA: aldo/keto reductase [Acidimicrobiales bacterium]|nr:aldo/keto reductase [Acidimicrobiales bacterium]